MVVDILILLVLAAAAFQGWRSGALSMLLSVVLLIVAGLIASAFGSQVGEFLKIGPGFARPVIGFAFTFVLLMIAGGFLKRLVRPKHGLLRRADGLLGMILGVLRAAFVLSIFLILFRLVHLPPESATRNSILYPRILKTSPMVLDVLKPYVKIPSRSEPV